MVSAPPLIVCDHKIARAKMYIFRELYLTELCRVPLMTEVIFFKSLIRYVVDNIVIFVLFYDINYILFYSFQTELFIVDRNIDAFTYNNTYYSL